MWSDTMEMCRVTGGRLVSIDSAEEYAFLTGKVEGFNMGLEPWWTAGRRQEQDSGEWQWFWDNGLNLDIGISTKGIFST